MKTLITGHPKTGTTYLCRVLDCLLSDTQQISRQLSVDLKRIYRRRPHRADFSYLNNPLYFTQRIIPAYDAYIVLYRDFRDTLVSCYFQQQHREQTRFAGSIGEFVDFSFGGIRGIVAFYNEIEQHAQEKILPVSYERMTEELGAALVAGGIEHDAQNYEACFQANTFAAMREEEQRNYQQATDIAAQIELAPKDPNNYDTYKTRRGKIGGYTDYLSADEIARINAIIADEYRGKYIDRCTYADRYSKP